MTGLLNSTTVPGLVILILSLRSDELTGEKTARGEEDEDFDLEEPLRFVVIDRRITQGMRANMPGSGRRKRKKT